MPLICGSAFYRISLLARADLYGLRGPAEKSPGEKAEFLRAEKTRHAGPGFVIHSSGQSTALTMSSMTFLASPRNGVTRPS
jgi:hypothetical protein